MTNPFAAVAQAIYEEDLADTRATVERIRSEMKEAERVGEWSKAGTLALKLARLEGVAALWESLIRWPPVPDEPEEDEPIDYFDNDDDL